MPQADQLRSENLRLSEALVASQQRLADAQKQALSGGAALKAAAARVCVLMLRLLRFRPLPSARMLLLVCAFSIACCSLFITPVLSVLRVLQNGPRQRGARAGAGEQSQPAVELH